MLENILLKVQQDPKDGWFIVNDFFIRTMDLIGAISSCLMEQITHLFVQYPQVVTLMVQFMSLDNLVAKQYAFGLFGDLAQYIDLSSPESQQLFSEAVRLASVSLNFKVDNMTVAGFTSGGGLGGGPMSSQALEQYQLHACINACWSLGQVAVFASQNTPRAKIAL